MSLFAAAAFSDIKYGVDLVSFRLTEKWQMYRDVLYHQQDDLI